MAEKRMFARKIVKSARFLKMPLSSQALYFQLGVEADDDGVVEAFPVLMTCGAREDDLKVLVAKGFVTILNEDLVTFINDWSVNNTLRADRKVDSIYKELLVQMVPGVKLLEAKERSDLKKKKNASKSSGRTMDGPRTVNGQAVDGVVEYSIDKDSIDEYSIDKDSNVSVSINKTNKLTFGEMGNVFLTANEYEKLKTQHGEDFTNKCIQYLDYYIEQNEYSSKSHYAAIQNWVIDATYEKEAKIQKFKPKIDWLDQMQRMNQEPDNCEPEKVARMQKELKEMMDRIGR